MTELMKWCEKSAKLAQELYLVNKEKDHTHANSKAALEAIGKAVAEHIGHKGKIPTSASVRAKLASKDMGVYEALTPVSTASDPKERTTKSTIETETKTSLGLPESVSLINPTLDDLKTLSAAVARLVLAAKNGEDESSPQELIEDIQLAEQTALADGVSIDDVSETERETINLMKG